MIFSIDTEDWAQSCLDRSYPVSNRVLNNTTQILDLLAEHGHKATFFVLANVAIKHPQLIQKIAEAGHEIASHGCNHLNLYSLSAKDLVNDVSRSVKTLEDTSGQKVLGYRAPNFSIREDMFETYCEALSSNGLKYDSSLFPMKVVKYGIEKKYSLEIFKKYGIDEHYLSYMKIGKYKLPFFGGGYFRLAPYAFIKQMSKQLDKDSNTSEKNSAEKNTGVFYMHPFEIDTGEYQEITRLYGKIPLIRKQYFVSRSTVKKKLQKLMSDFEFTSFKNEYYSGVKDEILLPTNFYQDENYLPLEQIAS